jgi:ribosomal protein S18 acetylase RimI-like enzyme
MISKLRKLRDRGIVLSLENLFNRIVPEWIFRFSVGDLLELNLPQMCQSWEGLESADFELTCVEDAQKRSELRKFTWNSVPLETTENDFGYAITKTGENEPLLGGVWAGTETFIEAKLGFRIVLEDNQAWLYCAYVDPNTRGLGIYKRLLSFVGSDLTARGFERLLVVIQPWNKASMHVHQRFIRNKIGRIYVMRLFQLSFVFCTGAITKNSTITTQQEKDPVLLRVA